MIANDQEQQGTQREGRIALQKSAAAVQELIDVLGV